MSNMTSIDKSLSVCATCTYWGGRRQFDGIGLIYYDVMNSYGKCMNVGWKGFSGSEMNALNTCMDYSCMYK